MRKLIRAAAAAIVLGATGAAADYDYVDDKGYRHWDHTGTDATEKPAASTTPKASKRRPAIHKTASKPLVRPRTLPKAASKPLVRTLPKAANKPLVTHGTLPVGHVKSGDESPNGQADRDALFQEFQEFLSATKPVAVEPPKREPTTEPQPLNSNQQNTVSNVVVPDKVPELFFPEGAKIIELLQATGYSDYAPHEIPREVI